MSNQMNEKDSSVTVQRILDRVSLPSCFLDIPACHPFCGVFFWHHVSFFNTPVPPTLPSIMYILTMLFFCLLSISSGHIYTISYSSLLFSLFFWMFLKAAGNNDSPWTWIPCFPSSDPITMQSWFFVPLQFVQTPDPGQNGSASTPPSYR